MIHGLKTLVDTLVHTYQKTSSLEKLLAVATSYQGNDRKEYVSFSDEKYTRNQVYVDNSLEVLILGWQPGQKSPVHDHPDAGCIYMMLEGEMTEYHFVGKESNLPAKEHILVAGEPKYIHNQYGFHALVNHSTKQAVSLHVYSPPHHIPKIMGYIDKETLKKPEKK